MAKNITGIHVRESETGTFQLATQRVRRSRDEPIIRSGKTVGSRTIQIEDEALIASWQGQTTTGDGTSAGTANGGGELAQLVEAGTISQDLADRIQAVALEFRDAIVRQLGFDPPPVAPSEPVDASLVGSLVLVPEGQGSVSGELVAIVDTKDEQIAVVRVGSEHRAVALDRARRVG